MPPSQRLQDAKPRESDKTGSDRSEDEKTERTERSERTELLESAERNDVPGIADGYATESERDSSAGSSDERNLDFARL